MARLQTLLTASLLCAALTAPSAAQAADGVSLVVVRENGVGSAAQAQQYLDRLVAATAKVNGWASASGKYFNSRVQARGHIKASTPAVGIMSLGAFLGLRKEFGLKVLGSALVDGAGGRRYHIVSKTAASLDDCKQKSLASDHLGDRTFVQNVVLGKTASLGDFQLVETRRPLQTIKKVTRDEAVCALIDDAQFADLANVEGGSALKAVWSGKELPPMVVVAFSGADTSVTAGFRKKLGAVCKGEGAKACADSGIKELKSASESAYKAVIAAYGK